MKTFVTTVMALIFTALTHADEHGLDNLHDIGAYPTEPYPKGYANWGERKPDKSHCTALSQLAEKIMENRQKGVPMHQQMERISGTDEIHELGRTLIVEAYDTPKFGSPKYKNEAITEYGNEAMLACYKAKS
jgi:hypothetical protein